MLYRVIGLMSGSSLDGLDIVYTDLEENSGRWTYKIIHSICYQYTAEWVMKLESAPSLNAVDYQLLHAEYGHFTGQQVNAFIEANDLQFKIQMIASHGHTVFHYPAKKMTAQLGDGASIAAATGIHVISDLRAMDIALNGQGAPIVPIGEKLLLPDFDLFLNLGGIANISAAITERDDSGSGSTNIPAAYHAFDVCPANTIMNILAREAGKEFDRNGEIAATGKIKGELLQELNALQYYRNAYPKSLANDFGTAIVYPIIRQSFCETKDALRTYVEHICIQIKNAIELIRSHSGFRPAASSMSKLLVTGGGAHNSFLIRRLEELLQPLSVELVVPAPELIDYKEALIMALIGVLRWREENNVLSSVTGATRDSIGGSIWMGQEG